MSSKNIVGSTIHISSRDRLTGGSIYDFDLDLSKNKNAGEQGTDVLVRWTSIPSTIYNVNEYTNVLTWVEDQDSPVAELPCSITVPEKSYTGSQLASYLETAMTTESAANGETIVYSVSYDSQPARFTFSTATAGKTFKLTFSSSSASMSRLLGFTNSTDTSLGDDENDIVSSTIAQMFSSLSYNIHVQGYNDGHLSSNAHNNDTLISVPALVPFGHVLNYEIKDSNESFHIRDLYSARKRFYITTDYGNGLGEKPAKLLGDWEMFLAIRRFRNIQPKLQGQPKIDTLENIAV